MITGDHPGVAARFLRFRARSAERKAIFLLSGDQEKLLRSPRGKSWFVPREVANKVAPPPVGPGNDQPCSPVPKQLVLDNRLIRRCFLSAPGFTFPVGNPLPVGDQRGTLAAAFSSVNRVDCPEATSRIQICV